MSSPNEFNHIAAGLETFVHTIRLLTSHQFELKNLKLALDFSTAEALTDLGPIVQAEDILKALSAPSYHQPIKLIIWYHLKHIDALFSTPISYYPDRFYGRASFRFDGRYVTAQYFYPFGLGVVLRLGGELLGPLEVAFVNRTAGKVVLFCNLEDGWRLLAVFAGDTAADGPEYPGYSTMEEARDAYKREQDAKMMEGGWFWYV